MIDGQKSLMCQLCNLKRFPHKFTTANCCQLYTKCPFQIISKQNFGLSSLCFGQTLSKNFFCVFFKSIQSFAAFGCFFPLHLLGYLALIQIFLFVSSGTTRPYAQMVAKIYSTQYHPAAGLLRRTQRTYPTAGLTI